MQGRKCRGRKCGRQMHAAAGWSSHLLGGRRCRLNVPIIRSLRSFPLPSCRSELGRQINAAAGKRKALTLAITVKHKDLERERGKPDPRGRRPQLEQQLNKARPHGVRWACASLLYLAAQLGAQ